MNTHEKMRVISDPKDPLAVPLVQAIVTDLGNDFQISTVAVCSSAETNKCLTHRQCSIVVALFTENPAEVTASMVSVCSRGLPTCSGVVIILEPRKNRRTLVLPSSNNIVRKTYEPGHQLSVLILEALVDYYKSCEGGRLNLKIPNKYSELYDSLVRQSSLPVS